MPTRSVLRLAAILVLALLLLAYGPTLAPGITWANQGLDSGELAAAALVDGVAHPSGYPTYLLLARLFLALPGAEPAFKLNLLSATAAILTAFVTLTTVARLAAPSPWRPLAAALAALHLGLAPLFWSQALIVEVYTLSGLFAALLLRATLLPTVAPIAPWSTAATTLLAGIALGNHLAVLPFSLLWLGVAASHQPRWRSRFGLLLWFGLGLLIYLILPLRAAGLPPINWGGAQHWAGFWWLVRGQLYAGMAFGVPLEQLPARSWQTLQTLLAQFGPLGIALISYGLVRAPLAQPWRVRLLSLAPVALIVAFTLGYASYDAQVYLILTLPSLALWLGLGLAALLARLSPRAAQAATARGKLPALVALTSLLALLLALPGTRQRVDASTDQRATIYARTVLAQAPDRSLIFTFRDQDSFPLWYYHFGQGLRPDLVLVTAPLLGFEWYRESLRATYPHLSVPETAPLGWEQTLTRSYDQGPSCRTQLDPTPTLICAPPAP